MPIPSQTLTIQDPGLGVTQPSDTTPIYIGGASGGTTAVNTVDSVSSNAQIIEKIGYGPLASSLSYALAVAGGPILFIRSAATVAAANSAVTQSGAGPLITLSAAPLDAYDAILEVVAGGALGAGTFRYSLDGGSTYGPTRTIPAGGSYVGAATETGLTITFPAGVYVAGETYTWTSTPAQLNGTDVTNAMAAALATTRGFKTVVFAGEYADATAGAVVFAVVAAEMTILENNFKFARALMQTGVDTPANVIAAFNALADTRVGVSYSTATRANAMGIEGYALPALPAVDVVGGRVAATLVSTDLKRVASGPLKSVTAIGHNEYTNNAGLDDARVTTLRSWENVPGYFVTQGRLLAPAGSDYAFIYRGRVMDVALHVVYAAQALFIGRTVRTVSDPVGAMDPRDAVALQNEVLNKLRPALLTPINAEGTKGFASEVQYLIDQSNNIVATNTVIAQLGLRPLGYIDFIRTTVGYTTAI